MLEIEAISDSFGIAWSCKPFRRAGTQEPSVSPKYAEQKMDEFGTPL
jgi:hypothetical protein